MNKLDFLFELEKRLQALPDQEKKQALEYYFEIVDDRMDCGMTEEEAVAACGNVDEIAKQIIMDTPLTKLVKQKNRTRRKMRGWEIALLCIGSPIWFSLLVAAFCVLIALSAALWCVVISLFAVSAALSGTALGLTALAILYMVQGQLSPALLALGCALILAGLAVLIFLLSKYTAKGVVQFHKLTFRGVKRCFIRKETKQ